MDKTERKSEIMEQLNAFNDEKYERSEYLNELLKLQSQMSDIAFNGANPDAKIWEIYNYLSSRNEECKNIANTAIDNFKYDCSKFNNEICKQISGIKGENFTCQTLERLKSYNIILRNVELEADGLHSEIDFLVFTKKAIFILEVKNSKTDIFINEDGEFYRHGNREYFDCNIKEKMQQRENLLTKVLNNAGIYRTNIVSLLVFTNNRIQIENYCKNIEVAFLGQLVYKIDRYSGWNMFTEDGVEAMADTVKSEKLVNKYSSDFNFDILKNDFAEVISTLETYSNKPHNLIDVIRHLLNLKLNHKQVA